jgi:hypothetical protein
VVAALEPPTLLLGGEIAVFDRQLVSHFGGLRGPQLGQCCFGRGRPRSSSQIGGTIGGMIAQKGVEVGAVAESPKGRSREGDAPR